MGPLAQKVIPTPDVSIVELLPTDIVLVCCDGLVERLTNEQVVAHLVEQLKEKHFQTDSVEEDVDPALIMCSLLEFSLARGSKDNMSAALYLPSPSGEGYGRADEYLVGPFSEWASDRAFVDAFFADALKHGISREQAQVLINQYNAKQNGSNTTAAKIIAMS